MISEACTRKMEELRASETLKTKLPDVPLAFMLLEASNLYEWCQADREALIYANLDWKVVEDLPLRIEALKSIEAVWNSERLTTTESQQKWKAALPVAIKLKKELIRCFFYAYKNNMKAYSKVQRIAEGNDYADMNQDLISLAVLGKKNPDELNAIHLDMSMLDTAYTMSFELGAIWARTKNERISDSENLKLRNKAFYHLKEGMEAVRFAGKYAFRHDKERLKGYLNGWSRKKHQLYKKKNK
jgi:hypothetical protein